jgi:hypothetical protein
MKSVVKAFVLSYRSRTLGAGKRFPRIAQAIYCDAVISSLLFSGMPIAAVHAPRTTTRIPYIVLVEAHEIALILNLLLIFVGLSICSLSVFFRKRLPNRLVLFMLVALADLAVVYTLPALQTAAG